MHPDTETTARHHLATLLTHPVAPESIDLDAHLTHTYHLTSLNKILLLTELCEATETDPAHFTELDLQQFHTLRDITNALTGPASGEGGDTDEDV
ncbi:acyl carrier protein [Streptomyces sp. NPDC047315]|uniref:acyl carrier protein n=1 Tax=Streptomyces sp. NPDC047315 TaxID=3155142 RepID=UPI0033C0146F